jgi:hypothetical protein
MLFVQDVQLRIEVQVRHGERQVKQERVLASG